MCCSSRAWSYGRLQSCGIHNSFASYDGTSFALVALTGLIVSELKRWVTWSHKAGVTSHFSRGGESNTSLFLLNHINLTHFYLWCKKNLKNRKFLFAFKICCFKICTRNQELIGVWWITKETFFVLNRRCF